MRVAGSGSWHIGEAAPVALLAALFLRDTCALEGGGGLPPCEPPPQHGAPDPDVYAPLSDQWNVWWAKLLDRPDEAAFWLQPPDFVALSAYPELRAAVAGNLRDAVAWASDRHREHARMPRSDLGEVVRQACSETNHPIPLFNLRIDCLPVQGIGLWAVSPGHVLVTFGLCRDRDSLHRRLLPVVAALM